MIRQEAISPIDKNWPYIIQGDTIICQCNKYGKSFAYISNFRKPVDTESPKNILKEIIDIWLDVCSSLMVPDYLTFLSIMNKFKVVFQTSDPGKIGIYNDFFILIVYRLSQIEHKIKGGFSDITYFNKFKLLLKAYGDMPHKELETYITPIVLNELRKMIEEMRES